MSRGRGPRLNSLKAQRRMQPSVNSSYLEGPHNQLKDYFHFSLKVAWEKGEHDVVNSKQRDQQKGGLGQPPGDGGVSSGCVCPHAWTRGPAWAQKMETTTRMWAPMNIMSTSVPL